MKKTLIISEKINIFSEEGSENTWQSQYFIIFVIIK